MNLSPGSSFHLTRPCYNHNLFYAASHTLNNPPMKYNSHKSLHFKNSWKFPVIPATIVPHSTKAMSNQTPLLQWPFEIKRNFTDVSACSVWTFSAGKHHGMVITHIFRCSVWEAAAIYLCTMETYKIQTLASVGPEPSSLRSPEQYASHNVHSAIQRGCIFAHTTKDIYISVMWWTNFQLCDGIWTSCD